MNQTIVKSCRDCRDWNDCNGHDYYSMSEIRYCRWQCIWLLYNLIDHQDGKYTTIENWPPEGKETGYDNTLIQHSRGAQAPFESFRRITADVLSRLERTSMDGRLLLLEIKNDRLDFSQEARNALNYVNGWRRKRLDYNSWVKQRRYRSKIVELHPQIRNQGQLL